MGGRRRIKKKTGSIPSGPEKVAIWRLNTGLLGWSGLNTSFFFQAEGGIRYLTVTGVQTCALPIWLRRAFFHENFVHHVEHAHAYFFRHRCEPGRRKQGGTRIRVALRPARIHRRAAEF